MPGSEVSNSSAKASSRARSASACAASGKASAQGRRCAVTFRHRSVTVQPGAAAARARMPCSDGWSARAPSASKRKASSRGSAARPSSSIRRARAAASCASARLSRKAKKPSVVSLASVVVPAKRLRCRWDRVPASAPGGCRACQARSRAGDAVPWWRKSCAATAASAGVANGSSPKPKTAKGARASSAVHDRTCRIAARSSGRVPVAAQTSRRASRCRLALDGGRRSGVTPAGSRPGVACITPRRVRSTAPCVSVGAIFRLLAQGAEGSVSAALISQAAARGARQVSDRRSVVTGIPVPVRGWA